MASRRVYRISICLGLALVAALFGRAFTDRQTFVFRDAAHYYAPLFQWNVAEWRAGRVPLWNPLEGLGSPTLGENTASVFYPGQALLVGPLEFYWAYNFYIVSHLAIAAWARAGSRTAGAASRRASVGRRSSMPLADRCYFNIAMSCSSSARHGCPGRWRRSTACSRRRACAAMRSMIALAVFVALMVLGGDPQMAYHVAIAAALYGIARARRNDALLGATTTEKNGEKCNNAARAGSPRGWLCLGGGLVLAACLAAVQIVPAFELAHESPRAADDGPRNIWELIAWTFAPPPAEVDGRPVSRPERSLLLDAEAGASHMRHVYQFSVGPWRWLELAWPNIGGQQFPEHRRWFAAIGEKRIWAPSLYAGALMLPFAFAGWRGAGGEPRWRWMRWLGLGAALASFGEYGLGWVFGALSESVAGRPLAVGPEVGGVYWLMSVALPGYVSFRYPAKLWTIAALALAMFSARGLDRALAPGDQRIALGARRIALGWIQWLGVAGLAGLAAAGVGRGWFLDHMATAPADSIFGPLHAAGAWNDIALGFGQSAAVLCAGWLLLRFRPRGATFTAAALLTLATVDLAVAHRWLAPTADFEAFTKTPALSPSPRRIHLLETMRIDRADSLLPAAWRERGSPNRLREMVAWDRDTLAPKYHLPLGLGSVESTGMAPEAEAAFWEVARLHGPRLTVRGSMADGEDKANGDGDNRDESEGDALPHPSALDLAKVGYLILPPGLDLGFWEDWIEEPLKPVAGAEGYSVRRPLARAWIVDRVTQLPELHDRRPAAIRQRTETVLFPGGQPRDWRQEAVIETKSKSILLPTPRGDEVDDFSLISIIEVPFDTPQHVVIEAEVLHPGLLVLADAFDSGWRATIAHNGAVSEAEILRTDRMLRGVLVPSGRSVVEFVYAPRSFRWGAVVSGLAWLATSLWALSHWAMPHRARERSMSVNLPGN